MNPARSRRGSVLAITAFLAVSIAVFLWLFGLAGGRVGFDERYRVSAVVPDAFALELGADVRAAGVRIGRVVGLEPRDQAARVELELADEHAPLPRDSRITLRTRTLVGENYLELRPGDPRRGVVGAGGSLPAAAADESVQIDQVLRTLSPATRRHLRGTLRGLGRATAGRGGDINQTLATARRLAEDGRGVAAVLAARDRQVARVVADTGAVLGALAERGDALRGLVTDARTAAQAAAGRDAELRAALRRLPGTLAAARGAAVELGSLGRVGTPVVEDLRVAVRRLEPSVRHLAPAARDARRLTSRLPALGRALDPLLESLGRFSRQARPVVAPLRAVLREVEPFAARVAPYARDLGSWFATVGGAADTYDATGSALRVQMLFDEQTLAGALTPGMQSVVDAFKGAAPVAALGPTQVNPYPEPGTAATPRPPG